MFASIIRIAIWGEISAYFSLFYIDASPMEISNDCKQHFCHIFNRECNSSSSFIFDHENQHVLWTTCVIIVSIGKHYP